MGFKYSEGLKIVNDVLVGIGSCTDKNIIIPEGVTKIQNEAFYGNKNIESILFADSITKVEDNAFRECSNLKQVIFGENSQLEHIEYCVFCETAISEFLAPQKLRVIERAVFVDCVNLTTIYFPKSLEQVENDAFRGCRRLSNLYIDDLASYCNIKFEYDASPTPFIKNLYVNGQLTRNILFPDDVKVIREYAFEWCIAIESISFGENSQLADIQDFAFYGCKGFEEVHLPKSLKNIGSCAFGRCDKLKILEIPDGVETLGDEILYMSHAVDELVIPNSVKKIHSRVLGDTWLVKLSIPFVCSINEGRNDFHFGTFFGVYTNSHNSQYVPNCLKHVIITGDCPIYSGSFNGCGKIKKIEILGNAPYISDYAFHSLPELESLTIPASVRSIGEHAIFRSNKLSDIFYGGTKADWDKIDKYSNWCYAVPSFTVHCTDGDIIVNG